MHGRRDGGWFTVTNIAGLHRHAKSKSDCFFSISDEDFFEITIDPTKALFSISDEGFIEITIDPTKVPEDDLFPASIFVAEPVADENPPQTGSSTSPQKRRASSNKNNSGDDDDDVQGILPSGLHQRHLNVSDVEEDGCVAGMKQAIGSRLGHQRSIESGEVAAPSASVVAEVQEVADGKEQGNVSMGSIENEEMNNFTKGVNSLVSELI